MKRLLLVAALASLLEMPVLETPAGATTRTPGSQVEIADCQYSYVVGGSAWSVECRYRIDEGEWRRVSNQGNGGQWELRLPGTSVQATVVDYKVQWSYGDDVGSLRVGSRQVK